MAIHDLFSKRQKRINGDVPEVFTYVDVPKPLRVQLVQIINDGIGPSNLYENCCLYEDIHSALCREYGEFSLSQIHRASDWEAVSEYLLKTTMVERVIDIVELFLKAIHIEVRSNVDLYPERRITPDEAIAETNCRFREHGVGYEFVSGEMIRVDSRLIHDAVVKPALNLLSDPQFAGANDEFLKAYEHYRHGRNKECLAECLKAFESTMKSICDSKEWAYERGDTASSLINVCLSNGLFQTFLQTHVGNLRSILESGVPTVRNRLGGHGQGALVTPVTDATARFALHTTATNILFFIESM